MELDNDENNQSPSQDVDIDEILADDILDEYPSLKSVAPFLALASDVPWFSTLGEDPHRSLVVTARDYVETLGFPEAEPGFLGDWEEAAEAAESLDINSPAWEAEEQLRAALTSDVLSIIDENTLEMVMAHVSGTVGTAIGEAAVEASTHFGIHDEGFVNAVTGAAIQACYHAVLVGMAAEENSHPFAIRFQLFEQGRLPIGVIGNSFLIY
ncbi:hypothetical protein [Kordiimonas sp. SCSIO 12610]|uniref:hypothetical protein n=1 Tax=Kordiimonas sp. SCSIO 12610 TaxID=2829597 RepID=UPI00210BB369|nr:hypothetical protein [Kordiimonas sp. SCSIO 12610]UTW55456.1 hypothetical protein KFF44_00755 [Kordiimonas sp. SCSIO 12610]